MSIPDPSLTDDTPLRLDVAVKIAFPFGGMTVSGLRREAIRGRLAIEVIAGKQFVTLRAIEELRKKCRVDPLGPGCGLGHRSRAKMESSAKQPGLSETARASAARAALEKTARALKKSSPTISPKSTEDHHASATVIPLKSS
jgi:hypothetical protein